MSFQNCKVVARNVDSNEYHAMKDGIKRGDPKFIMSPSALNLFASIPPSKWIKGYERRPSPAKTWGNVFDTCVLTPDQFDKKYVVEPEFYTDLVMVCPSCGSETKSKSCQECGEAREEKTVQKPWKYNNKERRTWKAEQIAAGREPISFEMNANAKAAINRLIEVGEDGDDTIKKVLEASDRQTLVTGEWKDEATGLVIPVSALLDLEPRKDSKFGLSLGDLKTAICAQPFVFQLNAKKLGYHRQAAFCIDIFNAATGEQRNNWLFLISENYEPWEVNRAIYYEKDDTGLPTFIDLGRDHQYGGYEMALAHYCKCLKTGRWLKYNQLAFVDEEGWCVLRPMPKDVEQSMFGVNLSFGDGPAEDADWITAPLDAAGEGDNESEGERQPAEQTEDAPA